MYSVSAAFMAESLTTNHGMEDLLGHQSTKVRVLNEATRLGAEVVLGEMRQRAETETEWSSTTF
jgi:chromosome condensin MukBEF MukE localization factor